MHSEHARAASGRELLGALDVALLLEDNHLDFHHVADLRSLVVLGVAGDLAAEVGGEGELKLDAAIGVVVVGFPARRHAAGTNGSGIVALKGLGVFGTDFGGVFGACGRHVLGALFQCPR